MREIEKELNSETNNTPVVPVIKNKNRKKGLGGLKKGNMDSVLSKMNSMTK